MCTYVCQTSVLDIAGFSSNQDSIPGTEQCLYEPLGRTKWSGTHISLRSEAIRVLLGAYFCEFHKIFASFWTCSSKKQPLRSLTNTLEKLRPLSWNHNEGIFLISSPQRNMRCRYTRATKSKS